jgi:hypothetical protein
VLLRRYNALLLPLLQSSEYGHEAFVGPVAVRPEPGNRSECHVFGPLGLIIHCNRLATRKVRPKNPGWCKSSEMNEMVGLTELESVTSCVSSIGVSYSTLLTIDK